MSYENLIQEQKKILAEAQKYLLNDLEKFLKVMNKYNELTDNYIKELKNNGGNKCF